MRGRDPTTGKFVKLVPTKALTASVVSVPTGSIDTIGSKQGSAEQWQYRAWALWRIVGVLHYPTSFMAQQVARVAWDVWVDDKKLEREQSDEMMEAATFPLGVKEASRRLALNLGVPGDVWYARSSDEWAVWAVTTPKLKDRLKGADVKVRGWLADPVEPDKADSPVRAALDIVEEIRVLQALSRSQSRSRVAQRGLFFYPNEVKFPEGDDFPDKLQQAMTAPIGDEYAASAVVPPAFGVPGETIEKNQWKQVLLESPYDERLHEKLEAAIRRLALALNMPPEVLLGNMDSSHWNAWLSDEQTYRAHTEPSAVEVGMIFAEAMMQATNATNIRVTPDPSELLARRQSVADAFEAARLGAVGLAYVRRQMGADEEDAPTPEDIAILMQLSNRAPTGVPAIGTGQVEVGPPVAASLNGNGHKALTAASDRTEELDRLGRRLSDLDIRMLSQLQGAAEMAVSQAREKVEADQVGAQQAIADEMVRLGKAWSRQVKRGHKVLNNLGIDTSEPLWRQAAEASEHLLVDGMTEYVTANLAKTDSQMPALPTALLRSVLAKAGGSGLAVVAAIAINPPPTFQDPQGFAIGVLALKGLEDKNVALVQWRWFYGPMEREHPFLDHVAIDGQFLTADGFSGDGDYPGSHAGCCCSVMPVFREIRGPREPVEELEGAE